MGRALAVGGWVASLALVPACSLAISYPPSEAEVGAQLCHDGLDQDVDGLVDCADSDCTASCPEVCDNARDDDRDGALDCADPDCDGSSACPEEAGLCADGRDNDRDGRIDARDAACWPDASTTITRCASVLRTSLHLGATDFLGGTLESDPFGTGEGPWVRIPSGPTGVTHAGMSTGALASTHVTVVFHLARPLPPSGSPIALPAAFAQLGVPSATRSPSRALAVVLGGAILSLVDGSDVLAQQPLATSSAERVRAQVDLVISGNTAQATIAIDDRASIELSASLSAGWPDAPALELTLGTQDVVAGSRAYVESASIERQHFVRCGTLEPPIAITDDGLAEHADVALQALTRGPASTLCGVVAMPERQGQLRPFAIASSDDGASWTLGDTLFAPRFVVAGMAPANGAPPVRLAYDSEAATYESAVIVDQRSGAQEVYTSRSTDCLHWDRPSLAIADATDAGTLNLGGVTGPTGYAIDELGHTLTLLVWQGAAREAALVSWTSVWGDPGTWTEQSPDPSVAAFLAPLPTGRIAPTRPAWLGGLGADVVAPSGASPWVLRASGWTEMPALALAPSSEAGSFDAIATYPVALIEDACTGSDASRSDVWCGRAFYGGDYDDGTTSGWGHAFVRIAPRTP